MLKKLVAAMNPFAVRKPAVVSNPLSPDAVAEDSTHPHSFSCACKPCNDHTAALTRARLKRQGA